MNEQLFYTILLIGFGSLGLVTFVILFFLTAPYGRHAQSGWGPMLGNRFGWLVMESPASLLFILLYILSDRKAVPAGIVFLVLWQSHYLFRAFVYPFTLQRKKNMPLLIILFGFMFNLCNSYLQARWIYAFSPPEKYSVEWLADSRFIIGIVLFWAGYVINKTSDRSLHIMGRSSDAEYGIPKGGLYNLVSCPNYLGEVIEWIGWALAVWSWAGLVFALWTLGNLLPRSKAHHLWYRKRFPDYPLRRKALIPFLY